MFNINITGNNSDTYINMCIIVFELHELIKLKYVYV